MDGTRSRLGKPTHALRAERRKEGSKVTGARMIFAVFVQELSCRNKLPIATLTAIAPAPQTGLFCKNSVRDSARNCSSENLVRQSSGTDGTLKTFWNISMHEAGGVGDGGLRSVSPDVVLNKPANTRSPVCVSGVAAVCVVFCGLSRQEINTCEVYHFPIHSSKYLPIHAYK